MTMHNTLRDPLRTKTYTSKFYKKPMMKWNQTMPNFMRPVTREVRKRPVLVPLKYNNMLKTKRQIPMKTIKKFVFLADQDLDYKVTFEDMVDFILVHNLQHHIPVDTVEQMFWDAVKGRPIVVEADKTKPLSDEEIYNATRIQYRIDPETKKTLPHPGKFRKQWVLMFAAIGEGEPQQEVPTIIPEKIKYFAEENQNTFKPTIT